MMPDFSFAPYGYLTNMIDANMSGSSSVPRGWPVEREAIYAAGRRAPYAQKRRSLFWRGGVTHERRRERLRRGAQRAALVPLRLAPEGAAHDGTRQHQQRVREVMSDEHERVASRVVKLKGRAPAAKRL